MRKAVASIVVGAAFLIAAVAGFVIVPEHAPGMKHVGRDQFGACEAIGETGNTCHYVATGLSRTAYDALRITTWAVLIIGALLVVIGLITLRAPAA